MGDLARRHGRHGPCPRRPRTRARSSATAATSSTRWWRRLRRHVLDPRSMPAPRRSRSQADWATTTRSTSPSGWGCTPARRSSATAATSAPTCTAPPASPRSPTAVRCWCRTPPNASCTTASPLQPLGEHRLQRRARSGGGAPVARRRPAGRLPGAAQRSDRSAGNLPHLLSSVVGREALVGEVAEARARRPPRDPDRARRRRQDPARDRGGGGAGRRVPRRRVDRRARVGGGQRRPCPRPSPPRSASRRRATNRSSTPWPSRSRPVRSCSCSTTASTSSTPPRSRWPRCSGGREPPRCWPRRASGSVPRASTTLAVAPLSLEGGATSGRGHVVRRPGAAAARPDFGLATPDTLTAVIDICATVDGLPLGIELAAARMAAMSAVEVRDRLADRFRLLRDRRPRPDRQLTLRHAVDWSYDLLTDDERTLLRADVGLRRRVRARRALRGRAGHRRHRRAPPPRLARAQVARGRGPHRAAPATGSSRPSGSSPRTGSPTPATSRRTRDGTPPTSRKRRPSTGSGGTGPGGAPRSTGWRPSSAQPRRVASPMGRRRGDLECATDIAAHAALMGFSVQLFETLALGRGASSSRDRGRRPSAAAPLHAARATRASSGDAEAARASARTAPRSWKPTRGTTRASRATPRSSRRSAASTAATSTATSSSPRGRRHVRRRTRVRHRRLRRRAPVGRAHRGGAGADRGWRRGGPGCRQPLLGRLLAVDRGHGLLAHRPRATPSPRGTKAWPSCASTGCSSSRASSPATRAAAHGGRRRGGRLGAVRRRGRRVPTRRQRSAQLVITLACVPALFERLDRPQATATLLGALAQVPRARTTCPSSAEIEVRTTRRSAPTPPRP